MSSRNYKELKDIGTIVIELCTVLNKSDFGTLFQKADFTKLDRRLFSEIVYFLLEICVPDLVQSHLEPVVSKAKPHDIFVKEAFQIVNHIKERFPWSSSRLVTFQKSHFRDPRPEQQKVVEFLKQLLNVTLFIVSGTEPGQKSVQELNEEIAKYQQAENELLERKRLSDDELKETQTRLLETEAEFKAAEQLLRDKSIIPSNKPCDRATLLKHIYTAEAKLLDKINARLENMQ